MWLRIVGVGRGLVKGFAAMGEKRGLKNIGWGMMVKRKFEREKVVIVNGKKIGGWMLRGKIAAGEMREWKVG